MGSPKVSKLWFMALLLIVFVAGCGWRGGLPSPALKSIIPNTASQGQTVAVTLTGTGFVYGSTVNVGGALITVSDTETVNTTLITARFAIAPNAVPGPVNISVSTYGVTTNAVTFTIGRPREQSGQ
jgi:predicted small lipoprotein YifL